MKWIAESNSQSVWIREEGPPEGKFLWRYSLFARTEYTEALLNQIVDEHNAFDGIAELLDFVRELARGEWVGTPLHCQQQAGAIVARFDKAKSDD